MSIVENFMTMDYGPAPEDPPRSFSPGLDPQFWAGAFRNFIQRKLGARRER